MKKMFLSLLFIVLLIVGALTYIGVVPILSPIIVKAKDLGITSDPALVTAFDQKYNMINELPDGKVPTDREPTYTGSATLDVSLTSQEVTSIISYWSNQYQKTPIRDVQIKFNPDSTGEASGILEVSTAIVMAKQLGYSDADIEKGKSYVKYIAGDLPFYVSGKAKVVNNQVSLDATSIEIGRLQVPSNLIKPLSNAITDAVERRMSQVPGVNIDSMNHDDGNLNLVGTIPNTIK